MYISFTPSIQSQYSTKKNQYIADKIYNTFILNSIDIYACTIKIIISMSTPCVILLDIRTMYNIYFFILYNFIIHIHIKLKKR